MTEATKQEAYPLAWPEGWTRTRVQDRRVQASWRLPANKYRDGLLTELARMGASSVVISTNVPLNQRGDLTTAQQPRDPGVAVYFTRKPKPDFSWQDVLGVIHPDPSLDQIDAAYKRLAQLHHPDKGGDTATWLAILKARNDARDWVTGKTDAAHALVIACDSFTEVRWNLCSLRITLKAIRDIERCGATGISEKVFSGFKQLAAQAGGEVARASTPA